MSLDTTPSQTVGPFFAFGLTTEKSQVGRIAGPDAKGEPVTVECRLLDGDGVGVPDGMLEIWQADSGGKYNHPDDQQEKTPDAGWVGFGRMGTSEDGRCAFETIKPGQVPGPGGVLQAPHLNLAIFSRGMLRQLYTRIYFLNDPANEQDTVLALVPKERRETLMAKPDANRPGAWRFDIHLQGDHETVFFDI